MDKCKEIVNEMRRHRVSIADAQGKRLAELSLLVTVIIAFVVPQATVIVLLLVLFDVLRLRLDDRALAMPELQKDGTRQSDVEMTH